MRIMMIHLSDGHRGGGGGVAMYRLHRGLRDIGVDSRILCRTKTLESPYVTQLPRWPIIESPLKKISKNLGLLDIDLVSSFGVKRLGVYQDADVIDLQGIHTQTLSYLALPSLMAQKPGIFTLHDMWALTGHCAYSYNCERWKIGCGACPYPKTHPAIPSHRIARNNTHIEWLLKRQAYLHSNLAFVVPSTWLVELAKQSIIGQFPIHHIPYGIDTEVYQPMDKEACRAELGIRGPHRVLVFASLRLDNPRKGGDLLVKALQGLPASLKAATKLLTIGENSERIDGTIGMETVHLGYIKEDRLKAVVYNAADLVLSPSRADNLPLVLLESLACGTPMVAYGVGGIRDLVRPGITGYLAKPESVVDFRAGIVQLLEDKGQREKMGKQARAIAIQEYRRELQIERTLCLYRQQVAAR